MMIAAAPDYKYTIETSVTLGKGNEAGLMLFYRQDAFVGVTCSKDVITIHKSAKSKDEILNSLDNRFFSTEAKEKLKRMGDTNPERTIRRWLNADLIARMGKNGRVYTYRKLTAKETQKRQRASARKILKAQSAVNKRDMSK
jgi:hypothetical protein